MKIIEAIQPHMFQELLKLCMHELELDHLPEIEFVDESHLSAYGKNSFGEFDGRKIRIIVQNRHPMDVARTLSHELVHWKQLLVGQNMDGGDGSEVENAANAIAGIILRKFGEQYPEYFVNSLP